MAWLSQSSFTFRTSLVSLPAFSSAVSVFPEFPEISFKEIVHPVQMSGERFTRSSDIQSSLENTDKHDNNNVHNSNNNHPKSPILFTTNNNNQSTQPALSITPVRHSARDLSDVAITRQLSQSEPSPAVPNVVTLITVDN